MNGAGIFDGEVATEGERMDENFMETERISRDVKIDQKETDDAFSHRKT